MDRDTALPGFAPADHAADHAAEHGTDHLAANAPASRARRRFLTGATLAGGSLVLGFSLDAAARPAASAPPAEADFAPDAFLRIAPDGTVTMTMPYVEMGQGTYTSIPMLLAEELEVDLARVRVEHAPPDDARYANPLLGFQVTGGSTTIRAAFEPMRRAGASARRMLVGAAAARWGVAPDSCRAEHGAVLHPPSGRRLAYGALLAEAARQPLPDSVALKPASAFRLIGTPARRLDTPAKVNGTALYGIDARPPGLRVAALMQAPAIGGRLRGVDPAPALAMRGVSQVVVLDDCVAVVAAHMGAARKGLAALRPDWDDGPNAGLDSAAIWRDMAAASARGGVKARDDGDVDAALAGAAQRLDAVYQLPFLIHAAMEPLNCTVDVRADACEVWVGTQVLTRARAAAAEASGLPVERVTVHNHLLGGGFGRRLEIDSVALAVRIARQVKGPLKVVWSREEDIRHDMYRPAFHDVVRGGLDADGRVVAWHHRITGSSVIRRWAPPLYRDGLDPEVIDGADRPPYALASVRVEYQNHEPPLPTAFWRGVGPTHNLFVVESFIDELAVLAGRDPLRFRLDQAPDPRARAVLERAAAEAGWGQPLPARAGRGVALGFAFGSWIAMVCEVEVASDGSVRARRVTTAVDCGVVVNPDTVRAQIEGGAIFGLSAALHGQATVRDGRIEQSNFHDAPVLRMNELPRFSTHLLPSEAAPGGVGEPGTAIVAPALANAVRAATGVRTRRLPLDRAALAQA
ncbi:xanthine dehydrogenase family protein molybdopterin-binding subunit [Derxia gummosa]|uniref:Xanthine dehydrogenase family protein molybdopterin-binding subunit n=1 Tax=Derxia gummosa DSM 723 TaxID=1121388 RepID=A0A8B6X9U1_9BURK|nr:molybdopterin cofactor-binding domain-containing protein [Derxia gummosa]